MSLHDVIMASINRKLAAANTAPEDPAPEPPPSPPPPHDWELDPDDPKKAIVRLATSNSSGGTPAKDEPARMRNAK